MPEEQQVDTGTAVVDEVPPTTEEEATKTFTTGADGSVGFAVPPDRIDDPSKNESSLEDEEETTPVETAQKTADPRFRLQDVVYSKANRQYGMVTALEPQANTYLYSITLLGRSKQGVGRGIAIVTEADLEPRNQGSIKGEAEKANEAPALDQGGLSPTDLVSPMRAIAVLAKRADAGAYDDRCDRVGSAVQYKLRALMDGPMTDAQRDGLHSAERAVDRARWSWGEGDNGAMAGQFESAKEMLRGVLTSLKGPENPRKSLDEVPNPAYVEAPTMRSVVGVLAKVKESLGETEPDVLTASLALACDSLDTMAVPEQAQPSLDMMRSLVQKAIRFIQKSQGLLPNSRQALAGTGDATATIYSNLSQAAFLGEMMTRKMAVRSDLRAIAQKHRVPLRVAARLWSGE